MKTGIYKILNKLNNKVYIGSAIDIKKRWRDHKWCLIHNKHHNSHLQSSWNKYGINSFDFLIINECETSNLLKNELIYILYFNSFNNDYGYNVNDPEHVFLNRKHSKKTKEMLSLQKIGDKNPMYGKCGNKHHNFNKEVSIKTRNKISLSRRGITVGDNHPMAKLNSGDVIKIREMYNISKISQVEIARQFNVSHSNINSIIKRKTWTHVL